jgi:hypothetical protein
MPEACSRCVIERRLGALDGSPPQVILWDLSWPWLDSAWLRAGRGVQAALPAACIPGTVCLHAGSLQPVHDWAPTECCTARWVHQGHHRVCMEPHSGGHFGGSRRGGVPAGMHGVGCRQQDACLELCACMQEACSKCRFGSNEMLHCTLGTQMPHGVCMARQHVSSRTGVLGVGMRIQYWYATIVASSIMAGFLRRRSAQVDAVTCASIRRGVVVLCVGLRLHVSVAKGSKSHSPAVSGTILGRMCAINRHTILLADPSMSGALYMCMCSCLHCVTGWCPQCAAQCGPVLWLSSVRLGAYAWRYPLEKGSELQVLVTILPVQIRSPDVVSEGAFCGCAAPSTKCCSMCATLLYIHILLRMQHANCRPAYKAGSQLQVGKLAKCTGTLWRCVCRQVGRCVWPLRDICGTWKWWFYVLCFVIYLSSRSSRIEGKLRGCQKKLLACQGSPVLTHFGHIFGCGPGVLEPPKCVCKAMSQGPAPAFSAPSTPLVKSESSFPPATTFTGLPSPHGCQTLKGYSCGVVGGCAL